MTNSVPIASLEQTTGNLSYAGGSGALCYSQNGRHQDIEPFFRDFARPALEKPSPAALRWDRGRQTNPLPCQQRKDYAI